MPSERQDFQLLQGLLCSVVKYLTFPGYRDGKQLEVSCLILFKKREKVRKRPKKKERPLCFPGLQPEVGSHCSASKFAAEENKTCAAGGWASPPPSSLSRSRITCHHATLPSGSPPPPCRQPRKKKNAEVFFFFLMILPEVLGRWRRLLGSLRHLPAFLQD